MAEPQHHRVETNGIALHCATMGDPAAPAIVCLHGFPENWTAWARVAEWLADDFHVILPDQRGFNLSDKPDGVEAYATKHMVADLAGLLDALGLEKVVLCGHDWGASVAYAFAMRNADRVSRLVIANGVHPVCFQKAIYEDAEQRAASQYMNTLRAEGSEQRLSRDGYRPLMNMFEKFSAAPWLTDAIRAAYVEAWDRPGALPAMLNWYRGSPIDVPHTDEPLRDMPITEEMRARYRIPMPHLLLWGDADTALRPVSRQKLGQFCDDLTVEEMPGASHWLLHERPDDVAEAVRRFLG